MPKRRYMIKAKCPQCACRDISFLGAEKLREKLVGDEKEIEVLCPFCGTKHRGTLHEEEKLESDPNFIQKFFLED